MRKVWLNLRQRVAKDGSGFLEGDAVPFDVVFSLPPVLLKVH